MISISRPAELHEPVAHGVLEHLALAVVLDLMGRGLADIEHRLARPVLGGRSCQRSSPSLLGLQRRFDDAGVRDQQAGHQAGQRPLRLLRQSAPPRHR